MSSDVLPDGRVDHRGHERDTDWSGWGWQCLTCGTEDGPEVAWTIPYDVDGKPIREDWRSLPEAELRALCGMDAPEGLPMNGALREGSTWRRNPPKREVVRIERIWVYDGVPTVRAQPVRGGRPLVAPIEWLYENFTETSTAAPTSRRRAGGSSS